MRFLFAVRVTLANGNAPKINARGYVPTGANHTTRHSTVSNHVVLILMICLFFFCYFFFFEGVLRLKEICCQWPECICCVGKQYDFHGNCDYMMAKGAATEPNEKFHVTVQVITGGYLIFLFLVQYPPPLKKNAEKICHKIFPLIFGFHPDFQ